MNFTEKYGLPLYVFDLNRFEDSIKSLDAAFKRHYGKFQIAYSYKTNYTPAICKAAERCSCFAEVVSLMEADIALKLGVPLSKIVMNGPCKIGDILPYTGKNGALFVIDNKEEAKKLLSLAEGGVKINALMRLNFALDAEKLSRFGFDIENPETAQIARLLHNCENVDFCGIQCHIGGARGLEAWKRRAKTMLLAADSLFDAPPKIIDLGSGMFGEMEPVLAKQFGDTVPSFEEYAAAVGGLFAEHYNALDGNERPTLFVEPGTTLVANAVNFYAEVTAIKQIRGKHFAVLNCSSHNLGELSKKKNLPISAQSQGEFLENVDFVGYTCIENDIFYRGYCGKLAVGDIVEFRNVGSYSVNMKPPFIHYNCKMIELDRRSGKTRIIKEAESFDDIFCTYTF